MGGALPVLVAALAIAGATGCDCYASFRYEYHDGRGDGGPDDGGDGGADAGDAGRDAGEDAGLDAGHPELPDAQVPCHTEPHIDPFEAPAPELIWAAAGQDFPSYTQVCSNPLVIDLDPEGDGEIRPEIIVATYEDLGWFNEVGVLRAVDPLSGETIWTVPQESDEIPAFNLEATATPAAGDLDGDGLPEVVAMGAVFGTYAFRNDGTEFWTSPDPTFRERLWRPDVEDEWLHLFSGAVTLGDLEGDGTAEVVVGRVVLDGLDGGLRWIGQEADCQPGPTVIPCRGTNEGLGPISCIADLDQDGIQEVIAGPVVYEADGSIRWQGPGADGFCAVADILTTPGAEGPEVVVVASGYIRLLDKDDGRELWIRGVPGIVRGFPIGGAPTVADFDADGRPEIGVAQGSAYTVFDLDCDADPLPDYCLEDGVRWSIRTEDDSSSATGSSVFDFNGDGAAEVIYNDEEFFRIYDGETGWEVFAEGNSSRTRTENPVIADVDNDSNAEIVFPSNNEARFLFPVYNAGFEIWGDRFDRWVGARRIWNQHAYHITNVEEDGSFPARESPSWEGLNAYRQNLAEDPEEVLAAADLRVRAWFECTPGGVLITILVRNRGGTPVLPGVVIGLYDGDDREDGERIGEVVTTLRLEPNDGEELEFLWRDPPRLPDTTEVWIVVDELEGTDEGAVRECYEWNNRAVLEDVGC